MRRNETLHAGFLDGRDIRRCRRPLETGQAERLDLARPVPAAARTSMGSASRWICPLMRSVSAGAVPLYAITSVSRPASLFRSSMARWLAEPTLVVAEGVFLRVLADEREEILEIVGRHARRGADDQRPVSDQRHRREIVHHVIGDALVQERIDHVHRGRHHQRVAVGSGLGDGIGADRAGRRRRLDSRR